MECIFVLLSYKLLYPNHFFMSRGNHESENMNKMYGFEGEVKAKYSANMVDLFTEVYNWLPLSHCINEKVLVMHGGLFSKVLKFFYGLRFLHIGAKSGRDEVTLQQTFLRIGVTFHIEMFSAQIFYEL